MANADRGHAAMEDKNKHKGQAQAQAQSQTHGGKQSQQGAQAHQFAGHEAQGANKQAGHKQGQDKQQVAQMARKGGKH